MLAASAILAACVVVLGAYVRLKDAGLGCPDWPGCYGQLIGVPEVDAAGNQIELEKAWIEVAHRYLAGTLGLLVLAATVVAWKNPVPTVQRWLVTGLFILIIIQAILGALTVTELLKPVIVSMHLLGGMGILAILSAFAVRAVAIPGFLATPKRISKSLLSVVAVVLAIQIALGGWVSTNYAGLACGTTFPSCNHDWRPTMDTSAFVLDRELSKDASGKPITQQALATVNYVHRLWAYVVTIAILSLSVALWRAGRQTQAGALFAVLLLQLLIGIYIVVFALPLLPSLLHNAGAALLCIMLAAIAAVPRPN